MELPNELTVSVTPRLEIFDVFDVLMLCTHARFYDQRNTTQFRGFSSHHLKMSHPVLWESKLKEHFNLNGCKRFTGQYDCFAVLSYAQSLISVFIHAGNTRCVDFKGSIFSEKFWDAFPSFLVNIRGTSITYARSTNRLTIEIKFKKHKDVLTETCKSCIMLIQFKCTYSYT